MNLSNLQLRLSKWLDIAGEEFISKAFEYAHEAAREANKRTELIDKEQLPKGSYYILVSR